METDLVLAVAPVIRLVSSESAETRPSQAMLRLIADSKFSIDEFWRVQSNQRPQFDELKGLASVLGLADAWKRRLNERLAWLHKRAC